MEGRNVKESEIGKVVESCNILPRRNSLLITINKYDPEDSDLEFTSEQMDMLNEWQYVISAGIGAQYAAGDRVLIDVRSMIKTMPDPEDKFKTVDVIDVKPIILGDNVFTIISDNYVMAKEHNFEKIDDIKA